MPGHGPAFVTKEPEADPVPEVPYLSVGGYEGGGGTRAVVICPHACGIPRGFHVHGDAPGRRVSHCTTVRADYVLRPATEAEAALIRQVYANDQAFLAREEAEGRVRL